MKESMFCIGPGRNNATAATRSENDVGLRFIVVEGYASAYNFYAVHNHFSNLKRDDKLIKEKLDRIIKQNPEQTFYFYLDLKKS